MLTRLSKQQQGVHSWCFWLFRFSSSITPCGLLLGDVSDVMRNEMDIINKKISPHNKKKTKEKKRRRQLSHPCSVIKFVQPSDTIWSFKRRRTHCYHSCVIIVKLLGDLVTPCQTDSRAAVGFSVRLWMMGRALRVFGWCEKAAMQHCSKTRCLSFVFCLFWLLI